MKHRIFLILLLALSGTPAAYALSETEAVSLYNSAGALYREGRFAGALAQYEELMEAGTDNPDLYYNAANAAYRTESLGKAVLYLERVLSLAPSDEDALANLAFINSIKQDKEPADDNPVTAFIARRYNTVNINSAAFWSGVSFALAMLCATVILFTAAWKRMAVIAVIVLCSIIFVFSTTVLISKVHHRNTVVEAIILEESARTFSGPGSDNIHIFTVHEGTKVVIELHQDSWNRIRLKSGAGGWIQADAMGKI